MKKTNEVVKNNIVAIKPIQLSKVESEITRFYEIQRKAWLLIGIKLLEVEKHQLYKQHNYETFTPWLKALSQSLELKPSTLWKYLKIVRMIDEINLPFSDVNLKNVTGLEVISRIYEHNGDTREILDSIKQLDEKNITITELKQLASDLINPKPPTSDENNAPEPRNLLKFIWQKITKGFLACLPPKPIIKALPVLFVVFYITDMS